MPHYYLSVLAWVAAGAWTAAACLGGEALEPASPASQASGPAVSSDQLSRAVAQFNRGAGLLEQYRSDDASKAFEEVLRLFPHWTAARFNHALALRMMYSRETLELARKDFDEVLRSDPNHLPARFCLGLCYCLGSA